MSCVLHFYTDSDTTLKPYREVTSMPLWSFVQFTKKFHTSNTTFVRQTFVNRQNSTVNSLPSRCTLNALMANAGKNENSERKRTCSPPCRMFQLLCHCCFGRCIFTKFTNTLTPHGLILHFFKQNMADIFYTRNVRELLKGRKLYFIGDSSKFDF